MDVVVREILIKSAKQIKSVKGLVSRRRQNRKQDNQANVVTSLRAFLVGIRSLRRSLCHQRLMCLSQ